MLQLILLYFCKIIGSVMRRFFITIVCLLAVFFTAQDVATACVAPGNGSSPERVANAERAFIDLVVKQNLSDLLDFQVNKLPRSKWQKTIEGKNSRKIKFRTKTNAELCGMHFTKGEYFIVAVKVENGEFSLDSYSARQIRQNDPYSFKRTPHKKWFFW